MFGLFGSGRPQYMSTERRGPSSGAITVGMTIDGAWCEMPIRDRHTLLVGDDWVIRRHVADSLISEFVRIPEQERRVVVIDPHGALMGHWAGHVDMLAAGIGEAAMALADLCREQEGREAAIREEWEFWRDKLDDPYASFRDFSFQGERLLVCVSDLSGLVDGREDDEEEAHRRKAWALFERLLYQSGRTRTEIGMFVESGTKAFGRAGFLRAQFTNRIVTRVDTDKSVEEMLGYDIDASSLPHHKAVLAVDGRPSVVLTV